MLIYKNEAVNWKNSLQDLTKRWRKSNHCITYVTNWKRIQFQSFLGERWMEETQNQPTKKLQETNKQRAKNPTRRATKKQQLSDQNWKTNRTNMEQQRIEQTQLRTSFKCKKSTEKTKRKERDHTLRSRKSATKWEERAWKKQRRELSKKIWKTKD